MSDDGAVPSGPRQAQEAEPENPSWFRRHLVEVLIGTVVAILLAVSSYFTVHWMSGIEDRLAGAEKKAASVESSFNDFKSDTHKVEESLGKAITVGSEKLDKETRKTIRLILQVQQEEVSIKASLAEVGQRVQTARAQVEALKGELGAAAKKEQFESLAKQLDSIQQKLTTSESRIHALIARSETEERERVLLEARRRLIVYDEQYLYSKTHMETTVKIPPVSGFVGYTVRIAPVKEEYQVSTSVEVDFQNGILLLSGRVMHQRTKDAIRDALRGIPSVRTINDDQVTAESPG